MQQENGQLAEEYHPQQTPAASPDKVMVQRSNFSVNKKLLPIKGYYLVFMAAVGDLLPFIAIYMKQLGLTPHETGIIYGIMPFVGFFVRPLVGAVADKFKIHKLTLMVMTVLTGAFYFFLLFIPVRTVPTSLQLHTKFKCNTQDSFLQDCYSLKSLQGCDSSLTQFANATASSHHNTSLACNFSCSIGRSEFVACFTNDSGPYNEERCNGTLSRTKHLNFTIPDIGRLISKEIPSDRFTVNLQQCFDYDLKDVMFEKNYTHVAWQILCDRESELNCTVTCPHVKECVSASESFDRTFFTFFIVFLLANIAFAPIFPILDAAAYNILAADHHKWGLQRAWGTLGFAVFAVTAVFLTTGQDGVFTYSFYIFLPLCVIATIIAFFLNMSSDIKCGQFVKNVWKLLSHADISAFLFVVMYFGMLTGALETFLFWYLSMIGGSNLVFGFILLVNCCAELPILLLAGNIIKKIGLVNCLYLAMVCYAIRMIAYSFLENTWLTLIVEPLHGICFGLMYAAASSYASVIAPPGMSATIQGLLGGVHFGFGKGLGSLITGFMFDGIGPRWTWRTYCIVSCVLLVLYFLLNKICFSATPRPKLSETQGEIREELSRQEETLINP